MFFSLEASNYYSRGSHCVASEVSRTSVTLSLFLHPCLMTVCIHTTQCSYFLCAWMFYPKKNKLSTQTWMADSKALNLEHLTTYFILILFQHIMLIVKLKTLNFFNKKSYYKMSFVAFSFILFKGKKKNNSENDSTFCFPTYSLSLSLNIYPYITSLLVCLN